MNISLKIPMSFRTKDDLMLQRIKVESTLGIMTCQSFYFNKHCFITHLMYDIFSVKLSFANSSAKDHQVSTYMPLCFDKEKHS